MNEQASIVLCDTTSTMPTWGHSLSLCQQPRSDVLRNLQCRPRLSMMSLSWRDEPFNKAVAIARAVFAES